MRVAPLVFFLQKSSWLRFLQKSPLNSEILDPVLQMCDALQIKSHHATYQLWWLCYPFPLSVHDSLCLLLTDYSSLSSVVFFVWSWDLFSFPVATHWAASKSRNILSHRSPKPQCQQGWIRWLSEKIPVCLFLVAAFLHCDFICPHLPLSSHPFLFLYNFPSVSSYHTSNWI